MVETLSVLETAALLRELTAGLIAVTEFDEALTALVRIARDAVAGVRLVRLHRAARRRAGRGGRLRRADWPGWTTCDTVRTRRRWRHPPPRDDPRRRIWPARRAGRPGARGPGSSACAG